MTIRLAMIAAAALIAAPLAAQAQQGAKAERYTYRCTGKDGKKYYGSTIPTACLGTPIDQLNERGITIIMIEHIMTAVMSFSQRLVVLVSGRKIADGNPDDVVRDKEVERAYLGQ